MSKTALKVVSVIQLILGILCLILGIVLIIGLRESAGLTTMVVIAVLGAVFNIFAGIFGLRAAKDPEKKTPAVVLGTLAFINGLAGVILSFSVQTVCGFIIPLIYFICALTLRKDS